jgi:hypothetical protein
MLVFLIHYLGLRGLLYVYSRELRRKLKLVMIETLFRLHMLKVESFMFRLYLYRYFPFFTLRLEP